MTIHAYRGVQRRARGARRSQALRRWPAAAWEPTKNVEFVVPAGTGGGADQMARLIQGIVAKNNLMKHSIVVVNKIGRSRGGGFPRRQGCEGRSPPHRHHPFQPVYHAARNRRAVQLERPDAGGDAGARPVRAVGQCGYTYKTAKDFLDAVKKAGPNKFKMGGTGSKQEDQIITVAIEKATGIKFTYVPFKGGGEVATQLVGKHVDSTVNNPIEAVAHWRSGRLRPLCVFDDQRMPYKNKVTETMAWGDIPTCKEGGVPTEYVMLRGIFMPSGVKQENVDYYVESLQAAARYAGMEEVHGRRRLQPDFHGRQGLRELGR